MMLIILNQNPQRAAKLVPVKIKFKQLLELGQLICSADISSIFKPVKQGKELQNWVKKNPSWVLFYFETLYNEVSSFVKMKAETVSKLTKILEDLRVYAKNYNTEIGTVVFRYSKLYKEYTKFKNNSELSVPVAIKEYKEYVQWKGNKWL